MKKYGYLYKAVPLFVIALGLMFTSRPLFCYWTTKGALEERERTGLPGDEDTRSLWQKTKDALTPVKVGPDEGVSDYLLSEKDYSALKKEEAAGTAESGAAETKIGTASSQTSRLGNLSTAKDIAKDTVTGAAKNVRGAVVTAPKKVGTTLKGAATSAASKVRGSGTYIAGKATYAGQAVKSTAGEAKRRLVGEPVTSASVEARKTTDEVYEQRLDLVKDDPEKLAAAYDRIATVALTGRSVGLDLSNIEKDALKIRAGASVDMIEQKRTLDSQSEQLAVKMNQLRGELANFDKTDEAGFERKNKEVVAAEASFRDVSKQALIVNNKINMQLLQKKIGDGQASKSDIAEFRGLEKDTATRDLEERIKVDAKARGLDEQATNDMITEQGKALTERLKKKWADEDAAATASSPETSVFMPPLPPTPSRAQTSGGVFESGQ